MMSVWTTWYQHLRGRRPQLSVVVITYNMRREAPRTLQSLAPEYQREVNPEAYEVLVVDNGSSEPLGRAAVTDRGRNFSYRALTRASASPAKAINAAVRRARGDLLCIMIDGACLLTPGVLHMGLTVFRMFANPIVMTRYFFLGPGRQNETLTQGYSQQAEDALLQQIDWPTDGYRLFEIGSPLPTKTGRPTWFDRMFESCCLFLRKTTFEQIGGCDERFDLPGGGFLAPDLFRRAALREGADVVQLVGEGVFHQVHGGTTTNTSPLDREEKLRQFQQQYRELRGEDFQMPPDLPYYFGHMPNFHASRKLNGKAEREAA